MRFDEEPDRIQRCKIPELEAYQQERGIRGCHEQDHPMGSVNCTHRSILSVWKRRSSHAWDWDNASYVSFADLVQSVRYRCRGCHLWQLLHEKVYGTWLHDRICTGCYYVIEIPAPSGGVRHWQNHLWRYQESIGWCRFIMHGGTKIDATLIATFSSTKNEKGERDPEMHQTKKGNQ